MRTHRFRPIFDGLDPRIVLDGTVVPTSTLASVTLVDTTSSTDSGSLMPGEEGTAADSWDWVVSGAPPAPSYDPFNPPPSSVPIIMPLTTTN